MSKFIGDVSAYAYAVSKGYTGTEEEFAELMASYATVGQTAVDAKDAAVAAKTAAQTAATTATNKASEATTAAQTATTKAGEAQTSAQTASNKASEASQSASQASGYAQTAETAKTDAQTAKTQAETARDNAVTAKTAAETAQGKAEDAQAAAESVAESIPSDYSQLSEDVTELKSGLNNLSSGKIAIDLIESQKQKGDRYSNIKFEEGYTVNSSNGAIGSTSNMRCFATNVALKESAIVIGCEKIIVKCNTDYIARFTYAFFDRDHVLIGSVITINPVVANEFELTVPDGAYYLHCGGYGTKTANTPTACTTTFVYGVTSFFVGKLDEQLTSETLPAQGKATGTRIGALETLKDTTGLSKLRVIPNANNINFVARTGLTNLFIGYGAGANSVEDYPDGTMNNLNTYDGSFNVAVGFEAMNANVGGDHCTAVGYTALKQNINGDYNTCMGEDALYNNQYGSYNVAIGDHALMSNEGDSNIAIGASVARSITGVDDSVMIGSYAGVNMSGSKHNIAIGNRSGVESGVTHDCIVIGNDASATADKQIVIGTSVQESVVLAGKRINFNNDGTVTWESLGV